MTKCLEDYKAPSEDELKKFSLEQAEQIDVTNAEIAKRNKQLVDGAKRILMEVEPQNRHIRSIDCPVPPVKYAYVLRQLQSKEREMEDAARLNAAEKGAA